DRQDGTTTPIIPATVPKPATPAAPVATPAAPAAPASAAKFRASRIYFSWFIQFKNLSHGQK
ncbi:MAG: hypothetical protein RSC86_03130, partial [Oscillospiraceae bacterium]